MSDRAWMQDPAYRAKQAEATRRRYADHEHRAKMAEHSRRNGSLPASRAKAAAMMTERMADPAERAKAADTTAARWQDPEQAEALKAAMRAGWATRREARKRANRSAAMRLLWADPDYRAKTAGKGGRPRVHPEPFRPFPGDRCAYCWEPATTVDHVIPLSRGGLDVLANVVACCVPCNGSKQNLTPDEWLAAGLYRGAGHA